MCSSSHSTVMYAMYQLTTELRYVRYVCYTVIPRQRLLAGGEGSHNPQWDSSPRKIRGGERPHKKGRIPLVCDGERYGRKRNHPLEAWAVCAQTSRDQGAPKPMCLSFDFKNIQEERSTANTHENWFKKTGDHHRLLLQDVV